MTYLALTLVLLCAALVPACALTLGISADGRFFTLDGKPTFLNGISYYAGTSIGTPSWVLKDMDDIKACGMNWIRVWAFWGGEKDNVCVLTPDGAVREPYMSRLKTIIKECDKRGMIVDVTMSRGKAPSPSNQTQHLACARTLAKELKPFRNVYIDVGNERDVGDARFVSLEDVGELIRAIKEIDPARLCTASGTPGSKADLHEYLRVGGCDFVCPHLCRDPGCPAKTAGTVREFVSWMGELGRRVPVHLQEPFRRGYTPGWEPAVEDYYRDCIGGKSAGAAGWCLHNGSTRSAPDGKPRRSFGMSESDGRLFDQLDAVEKEVARGIDGQLRR